MEALKTWRPHFGAALRRLVRVVTLPLDLHSIIARLSPFSPLSKPPFTIILAVVYFHSLSIIFRLLPLGTLELFFVEMRGETGGGGGGRIEPTGKGAKEENGERERERRVPAALVLPLSLG